MDIQVKRFADAPNHFRRWLIAAQPNLVLMMKMPSLGKETTQARFERLTEEAINLICSELSVTLNTEDRIPAEDVSIRTWVQQVGNKQE